jgi:Tfp pilus assembly protein PilV
VLKEAASRADTRSVVNAHTRLRSQDGLSLIEVIVAATVLVIGILGTLVLMDSANATTSKTRAREGGVNLTRELVEAARSVPYANVSPGSITSQIQGQPGLADAGVGAGWTIRRRSITYTVTATTCTMDDARDGGGTHSAGGFCADSVAQNTPDATTGNTDKSPEDYKRVRVQASWVQGRRTVEAHQTTIINNPGSAGGPAVRTLTLNGSASPPAITGGTSLNFVLTTSSVPTSIHWLLDGADQAPVAVGGLSSNFDWNIGAAGTGGNPDPAGSAVDGTYVVSAEAFDMYDIAGPAKSLTVTLNRSAPDKVEGLAGGRNGSVVDLEWLEVGERDIVGYQVFRKVGGTEVAIPSCPMSTNTSCVDTSPPPASDGNVEYVAYAYDLDNAGLQRKGPVASDVLQVKPDNNPPFAPLLFTATHNADGTTTLTWTRPVPADPDGDSIDFYRIYRDGTTIADRYSRWDNPNLAVTFVDAATDNQPHCYWVTAVDRYFAESPFTPQRCA